jgi:general secretion pathway protein N
MRIILYLAVGAVALLLTSLVIAPAQWAAASLEEATGDRLELAEASGTLWNGSALLVLASSAEDGASRATLPERVSWRLSPWALLVGQVDLTLAHPSALTQPLNVRTPLRGGSITLSATTLRLPASLLVGIGAPWNTIRPGGILLLNWDRLVVDAGHKLWLGPTRA